MEGATVSPREIAVPVSVFGSLRRELTQEVGALPTIHALHHAGYEAGSAGGQAFLGGPESVAGMGQSTFWARLAGYFGRRGWGAIEHAGTWPGISLLKSTDWAEASEAEQDPDGSCHFSTGYLSGFLTELAGGPVAVLEVECRSRGDQECRWAFGSEKVIHDLYGALLEGTPLDTALSAL